MTGCAWSRVLELDEEELDELELALLATFGFFFFEPGARTVGLGIDGRASSYTLVANDAEILYSRINEEMYVGSVVGVGSVTGIVSSGVGGLEGVILEYRTGGMVRPSAAALSGKVMVTGKVDDGIAEVRDRGKILIGTLGDEAKRLIMRSISPVG
jgi:hypothetical protein